MWLTGFIIFIILSRKVLIWQIHTPNPETNSHSSGDETVNNEQMVRFKI